MAQIWHRKALAVEWVKEEPSICFRGIKRPKGLTVNQWNGVL